jgi:hypothetical protein
MISSSVHTSAHLPHTFRTWVPWRYVEKFPHIFRTYPFLPFRTSFRFSAHVRCTSSDSYPDPRKEGSGCRNTPPFLGSGLQGLMKEEEPK